MSTFSGLNTAYRGLVAARAGLDVVGQNISNATTEGYTRQRISTSAIGPTAQVGLFSAGARVGQGVSVDAIARLGDLHLDAQVRGSSAAAGYSSTRATALSELEVSLSEPGDNGLSTQLQEFWSAWQGVSNRPGDAAPAAVLLGQAGVLASAIASGFSEVRDQWADTRGRVDAMATELNGAAAQVADLNLRIRTAVASGSPANELIDQRGRLTETIASLAGATVRESVDGTVDVLIGGNAIVTGDSFRPVRVTGSVGMDGAAAAPVTLEWAHRPGASVALDSGEIAGALSVLAPATATGTGGILAEAAATYNALATDLAAQVNSVHRAGATPGSTTASRLDFFAFTVGKAPAEGLVVVPTSVGAIAVGTPGAGGANGSVADAIAQIGTGTGSPDSRWAAFVTSTGVATRSELHYAQLTDLAANSARNAQRGSASVDLDEENVNMLTFQHAYQGAARVMTAVDEMLDTLINRTGIVGR